MVKSEIEYRCNNCGHEGLNTRAVPDVPELVRYHIWFDNNYNEIVDEDPEGEYVRHSQAAKIISAKDKEVQELKEKLGVVSTERHADAEYIGHLQAELARIKAHEPVAYTLIFRKSYGVNVETTFKKYGDAEKYAIRCELPLSSIIPLYAAPVDHTAEIERLREALNYYANISPISYDMGHTARAALSGKDSK